MPTSGEFRIDPATPADQPSVDEPYDIVPEDLFFGIYTKGGRFFCVEWT